VRGAISYNERKVSKGYARLLSASGFIADVHELGFSQKLKRFESQQRLYEKANVNTLHISLNFPKEESLPDAKMIDIAEDYMRRIGFENQPFLVYRHTDTNHPHLHIVTTNIQANGKPIKLHYIGKNLSEPARKSIELAFGLIRAEDRPPRAYSPLPTIGLRPAKYGKEETKHAITNILTQVLQSYKFSDFVEFNSILRQFNVIADRGKPNSQTFQTGGLVYSLIDKNGYRIGRAIKASEIYGNPILKTIERKYAINTPKKALVLPVVKESVFSCLSNCSNILQFYDQLKQNRLSLEMEQDSFGSIQRLYFIDHKTKACLSHVELGVSVAEIAQLRAASPSIRKDPTHTKSRRFGKNVGKKQTSSPSGASIRQAIHILLKPEPGSHGGESLPPKKKRKRRKPSF